MNRFAICEAWYVFASLYHQGQGSDTYRIFARLDRIGFRPSPLLCESSLDDEAYRIYVGLVRSARM